MMCTLLAMGAGVPVLADSPPSDWTVEQLVSQLSRHREPALAFEEATYSSLLTEPLKSRGVLRFTPPATMEKLIMEPFRERYVIEGDTVLFESDRKGIKKAVSLDEYPALRSFVEAFRATFTNEPAQLMRYYETTIGGDRHHWTLLLRPREPAGQAVVDYILFTGSEGRVATIAIRAPDGDRSVMTLLRGNIR